MFRVSTEEARSLRSQIVILETGTGEHSKYRPRAFTEQDVALASNVDLARKLDALEGKYDAQFKAVFQAIRELMAPSKVTRRQIGFRRE